MTIGLHAMTTVSRDICGGDVEDSVIHRDTEPSAGSPVRRSNKENTPPGSRLGRDYGGQQFPQSTAAASRQELYQPREQVLPTSRRGYDTQRGLTVEELEKLQKPQVRRLANVTQLCEYLVPYSSVILFTSPRLKRR